MKHGREPTTLPGLRYVPTPRVLQRQSVAAAGHRGTTLVHIHHIRIWRTIRRLSRHDEAAQPLRQEILYSPHPREAGIGSTKTTTNRGPGWACGSSMVLRNGRKLVCSTHRPAHPPPVPDWSRHR